jgi:uncharacterized phosphatase
VISDMYNRLIANGDPISSDVGYRDERFDPAAGSGHEVSEQVPVGVADLGFMIWPRKTRIVGGETTMLTLMRHAETNWNSADRLQGRSDIPLNAAGRRQAEVAAEELAREDWDAIVSSPLRRAAETAQIVGSRVGIATIPTFLDLVERDYGDSEGVCLNGMTEQEFTRSLSTVEPEETVAARGIRALRVIAGGPAKPNVLIVTHGTLIRLTMAAMLGKPFPRMANCQTIQVPESLMV